MPKSRVDKRERTLVLIANYSFEILYFEDKPYVKLEEAEHLKNLAKTVLGVPVNR